MKNVIMAGLVSFLCCTAAAADLAAATAAWERQDFATALRLYRELADRGNPVAQQMLGEMYGFGEGVPEDRATAELWLRKAQDGGNADAAASLRLLGQRAANKPEIARYLTSYDGAELRLERYGCAKPGFPEVSRTLAEVQAVHQGEQAWFACYERFLKGFDAVTPVGKAIPAAIAETMSLTELKLARERMTAAYTDIANAGRREAADVVAQHDRWAKASKQYIEAMDKQNAVLAERRRRDVEEMNERYRAVARQFPGGVIK